MLVQLEWIFSSVVFICECQQQAVCVCFKIDWSKLFEVNTLPFLQLQCITFPVIKLRKKKLGKIKEKLAKVRRKKNR